MKLFIQTRGGQPFEHPILADNFFQVFPDADENNLPKGFAKFEKLEPPAIDTFEVIDGSFYEMQSDGVVREIWAVRSMTEEERTNRIQAEAARIDGMVTFFKQAAEKEISQATGEALQTWQEYLTQLNAYTYTDPFTAAAPPLPRVGANGRFLTNDMPGSMPSVTG
jgi:hypothetical protein